MLNSRSSQSATDYLLTMLLQRLEVSQPGLIQEMTDGVKADQASISQSGKNTDEIDKTFEIICAILDQAAA